MFEFLFSLHSTLMAMVPRGGIQIANTKFLRVDGIKRLANQIGSVHREKLMIAK